MALTRANAELLLIRRIGQLFTTVSLDGSTIDGTNDDLNDVIGYAIRQCGQTVDSVILVDDDDVARVSDVDKLLDIAELRALETAYIAATTMVTTALGAVREQYSDIAANLARLLGTKRTYIQTTYGIGGATLTAGVLDHNFQTSEPTSIN